MLQIDLLKPSEVSFRDRNVWQAFRSATPAFQSPLMGPDFAEAVGEVREDAAVAIWRKAGHPVAFLAHHRPGGSLARPIGAPWSDYHALITAPGETLDVEEALSLAGISTFRFQGLVDPHGLFAAVPAAEAETYRIVMNGSGEDYWETLRADSPKRFKNMRRLEHKLAREVGAPVFGPDKGPAAFARILEWKRDQFRRTGLHDVLGPDWSRRLMRRLFARRSGDFQGLLLTLSVDGRPIAGHFGVREGDSYHPWIAAFDPALSAYSPGQTFLSEAIRAMPRLGLRTYDLSAGSDHYKKPFASHVGTAAAGVVSTRPCALAGVDFSCMLGPAGRRVARRWDHIAETELSWGGRVAGIATAIGAASRRLQAAEAH
jgi:CelD/BcsL family acetyltransferase involved in cellulose biosynthesis